MPTGCDRLEEFDLDGPLNIVTTQVSGAKLDLVPSEGATLWPLDLRFVDWCPLAGAKLTINEQEAQAALVQGGYWIEDDDFLVLGSRHLSSHHEDSATLTNSPSLADEGLLECLISRIDDFVELKLE